MSDYVEREMPRYICHKKVRALKIQYIDVHDDDSATLTPADKEFAPFRVERGVAEKLYYYSPGGYYLVCADGYKSLLPVQAFEADYTRI